MSMRLDVVVAERGLAESRTRAGELIKGGFVSVDGRVVTKPSFAVSEASEIVCEKERVCPYVSRGGWKLEAALDAFCVDPTGLVCLDIGASSGGFTDCLLQRGAKKVYAVDSGVGQLHPSLSSDSRVISLEHRNARYLTSEDIPEKVSLAVMDVSFISQTKLYAAIVPLMRQGACLVSLVKPQFEVGRAGVGKGGIVRDEGKRKQALHDVCESAALYGLKSSGVIPSPIQGGDGNIEFLAIFRLEGGSAV